MRGLAAAGLVALLGAAGCFSEPANPGEFTLRVEPSSWLETTDGGGNPYPASHVEYGAPACADGVDNDLDGQADTGDDTCAGLDDANERLAGHQPFVPTSVPVEVNEHGVVFVDPADFVSQQREWCLDVGAGEPWCTGITLRGSGERRWGAIDEDSLVIPLPITIELEAVSGFPSGYGPDCVLPHIDALFEGTYDPDTGAVDLAVAGVPVGAAPSCGEWTDAVNGSLGVPTTGRSVLTGTLLDADGRPVSFDELPASG